MKDLHRDYTKAINVTLEKLTHEVKLSVEGVVKNVIVVSRLKDPKTLEQKMKLKGTHNVLAIDDVYGIRIIVQEVDDVYSILHKLKVAFPGQVDHDYIANPKVRYDKPWLTGKMLRLIQYIAYRNSVPFEIQITTAAFHEMNESLHAQYTLEKYGKDL